MIESEQKSMQLGIEKKRTMRNKTDDQTKFIPHEQQSASKTRLTMGLQ
jgi:hypothetical protein